MEQQWHDILLHNDTGDAAFHKGAPLLVEALQLISAVQAIPSAVRVGLHLRDAQQSSAGDQQGATYTEKHVYQEHAERIAVAAPLLAELRRFFQMQTAAAAAAAVAVVAVPELDGLLVPTSWAASLCTAAQGEGHASYFEAPPPSSSSSSSSSPIPVLREHPLFSYRVFLRHLDRLSRLVTMGEAFSASEPRVKVLQSRFSLYRAYNGAREDEYHPTFGGGDIKRAPKCDLRRLETCMSAASVVGFIEALRRDSPHYPLFSEEQMAENILETMSNSSSCGGESGDGTAPPHTASRTTSISVAEAVRRFFGTDVTTPERVITEEGLCLRPSYASDSTDRWLSLQRLADSGSTPRATLAGRLLRHILSVSGGANGEGELLARLIQPLLKRIFSSGSLYDRLELELTVTGTDRTELPRLARWCVRSGLLESCPGVYFRLLVVQDGYAVQDSGTRVDEGATLAPDFADMLMNIFSPVWQAFKTAAPELQDNAGEGVPHSSAEEKQTQKDMLALLARTTGFSVSLTQAAAVQEMPLHGDPAGQFPLPHTTSPTALSAAATAAPPDAFFVYHVWRNVQLLNAFILASGPKAATNEVEAKHASATRQREKERAATPAAAHPPWSRRAPFTFVLHGGANSRTLFGESVLGLLLADTVVNPTLTFEWSPLTYLYMLTQRHVILTPSRNRCSSVSVKQALNTTAIPIAVQAGLHVSVATLDPLFYDTTNDALSEELMELTKQRGLANADVTEMCLRGLEASSGCFSWAERRHLFGYAWPRARARFNQFAATQVSSLRLHHRACALEHELDLLFAAIPNATASSPAGTTTPESTTRALLYLPPATATLLDPKTSYRRSSNGSVRALQREHDPTLLQRLSGYRSHESQMQYPRILISGPDRVGPSEAAKRLMQMMATREAYQRFVIHPDAVQKRTRRAQDEQQHQQQSLHDGARVRPVWTNGVLDLSSWGERDDDEVVCPSSCTIGHAKDGVAHPARPAMPSWQQFQHDTRTLRSIANADPTVAKYANKRLDMLESKYKLHVALTNDDEENYSITVPAPEEHSGQRPDAQTMSDVASASQIMATAVSFARDGVPPTQVDTSLSVFDSDPTAQQTCQHHRRIVQPIRGDAHNCVKVDVHCHMASGITAKTLLQFMRRKIRDHPDDVVGVEEKTGRPITLVQFFAEVLHQETYPKKRHGKRTMQSDTEDEDAETAAVAAGVARILSEMPIAALQVHAGKATFHRFDRFNHRFSPMGMSSLRSLFLKTENFMQGRYFAELIRVTFEQNEVEGNTFTENRISIYGRTRTEWDRLSRWFVLHGMSHRTNSWMIQVPRLFHLYQRSGVLRNFQEMLTNIFEPLWEASCFPEKHPYLHFFLSHVSGFDSVDNESDREPDQTIDITPAQWTSPENPPFAYYMFYMWSNITTLNRFRASRGLNTFQYRPHAGESGDPDHMADVFFLADGIGHGINLDKRPVLQYLYYLAQIPLAVVPMSNNLLFCRYKDHPLPSFLRRGLNIAMGTDGALIFHRTEQPLLEEYGTAEALWNLSAADICELAASSVRGSGFPAARKRAWLGPLYYLRSVAGNDVARSHVPQTRCAFRYEAYMEEVSYLQSRASCEMACRAMLTPLEEELNIMDAMGISREELLARRWAGAAITECVNKVGGESAGRLSSTFDASRL